MIKVNKKINLAQLDKELNGKGLNGVMNENSEIIEISFAENNDATESQLKKALDAHIAIDEVAAKAAQKAALLERLGITEAEAKLLLG
jgi:hypothetical protein